MIKLSANGYVLDYVYYDYNNPPIKEIGYNLEQAIENSLIKILESKP